MANAGLTLSSWKGWSGSLRMRAINHYRLDGEDPSIRAAGHTVFDFGMSRQHSPRGCAQLRADNLTNRAYYETQNYFESRLPGQRREPVSMERPDTPSHHGWAYVSLGEIGALLVDGAHSKRAKRLRTTFALLPFALCPLPFAFCLFRRRRQAE